MPDLQTQTLATVSGPSQLTITFATDVHELIRVGALVNQGGTLGMGIGVGTGIGLGIGGHWIIALIVAVVGLFIKASADEYRQNKFRQLQTKWHGILGGLSEDQMREFVKEIGTHYPGIVYGLRSQVLGNTASERFLRPVGF